MLLSLSKSSSSFSSSRLLLLANNKNRWRSCLSSSSILSSSSNFLLNEEGDETTPWRRQISTTHHHQQQQQQQRERTFSATATAASSNNNKLKKSNTKPRVVIIGSGWGGTTLARRLNKDIFDVRLISPVNHFLFTPLLPSTAVGTLEFRAIQEPIRTIPKLGEYYQAKARGLDTDNKIIICEDLFQKLDYFNISYDILCIAAGNKTNTFNTPGILERENQEVFFLKHLYHARQIRNRILECFERASNPSITKKQRKRLLTFIVVGGGPTSCEFMTELYDFLMSDVVKWYPDLLNDIELTLVEAGPGLLGSFDKSLAEYYLKNLYKRNINVKLSTAVTGVEERWYADDDDDENDTKNDYSDDKEKQEQHKRSKHYTVATFADGTELPFGTMVWSAGLAPVKFIDQSKLNLSKNGKIIVDEYLKVPNTNGRIFALGDCSIIHNTTLDKEQPLPPTASVAEQQAYYIGDCLNTYYAEQLINEKKKKQNVDDEELELPKPGLITPALMPWQQLEFLNKVFCTSKSEFQYMNRGAMAAMGFGGGVSDLTKSDLPAPKITTSGFAAFFAWRSAYWTKQLSYTNMMLIPMYWFKQLLFGRDISRF